MALQMLSRVSWGGQAERLVRQSVFLRRSFVVEALYEKADDTGPWKGKRIHSHCGYSWRAHQRLKLPRSGQTSKGRVYVKRGQEVI